MSAQSLVTSAEVLTAAVGQLTRAHELPDDVPNIQYNPLSIEYEKGSYSNPMAAVDHRSFHSLFATELEQISRIEQATEQGHYFVHMLYTFRSVSKAIPAVTINIPGDASTEEKEELAQKKHEINRKVVEILRPEILKLKDLMQYVTQTLALLIEIAQTLAPSSGRKRLIPEGLNVAIIKLLDVLLKLDDLKDMKSCLNNDFTRYRRAVTTLVDQGGGGVSSVLIDEQQELQPFVSSLDPKKSKMWILQTLREDLKRIGGHEELLMEIMEQAMYNLENGIHSTPDEKFRYMHVIPYLLILIDGDAEDSKSLNVFKCKLFKAASVQKLFKEYPVVPLYADVTMTAYNVLAKAPHFDPRSMGAAWGEQPDARVVENHQLTSHWKLIKEDYTKCLIDVTALLHTLDVTPFQKTITPESLQLASDVYELTKKCFQTLSSWASSLALSVAWKYTHPCSDAQLVERKGADNSPGSQYERALRYNYSEIELSALVDVVSMIKSLASLMSKSEANIAPIIRFHIHHTTQQLIQGDLQPLLHRADKRKNPMLPALLEIRALAADWLNGMEPREDYKSYSRKQGHVSANHPARVVAPGHTQLNLLRVQLRAIYDANSSGRQKQSLFGKVELEKEDVDMLRNFYYDSYHFTHLLNYSSVLRAVSDLSGLWYREFFLELTSSVQFPIEMSLPWIITEHVVRNQSSHIPTIENFMYALDVYNDAAHKALYTLSQQYLYDEIEAEANLVFDQLVFLISEEIYTYYKNFAATGHLDKLFKTKIEQSRGEAFLTTGKRRYDIPTSQRHIQLLGRSIDLNFLIGQHVSNKIMKDVEVAIKKFESSDVTGVAELNSVMEVIKDTHHLLSEYLSLDKFKTLFNSVNDCLAPSEFCGRINLHLLRVLVTDLFPNFSYMTYTKRFVRSPMCLKPLDFDRPPKVDSNMLYGSQCSKAFEICNKLTRGFFGKPHMEALISLGGYADFPLLIEECLRFVADKIQDVQGYVEAMTDSVADFSLPKFANGLPSCFSLFETHLAVMLEFQDLKTGVFQNLKEIGNALAFFVDISEVMDTTDSFQYATVAPFFGITPNDNKLNDITAAPAVNTMVHFMASCHNFPESVKSVHCINQIPDMCKRVANTCEKVAGSKSLIRYILDRVCDSMYQLNIMNEWKYRGGSQINTENSTEFWRLWSALSFLYNIDDQSSVAALTFAEASGVSVTDAILLPNNEDQFGHGFQMAGCMFIHMLGLRENYELLDFSYHLLNMESYGASVRSVSARSNRVDPSQQEKNRLFLQCALATRRVQNMIFAQWAALRQAPKAGALKIFHPPKFHEEKAILESIKDKQSKSVESPGKAAPESIKVSTARPVPPPPPRRDVGAALPSNPVTPGVPSPGVTAAPVTPSWKMGRDPRAAVLERAKAAKTRGSFVAPSTPPNPAMSGTPPPPPSDSKSLTSPFDVDMPPPPESPNLSPPPSPDFMPPPPDDNGTPAGPPPDFGDNGPSPPPEDMPPPPDDDNEMIPPPPDSPDFMPPPPNSDIGPPPPPPPRRASSLQAPPPPPPP